jgi:hypothetical protein
VCSVTYSNKLKKLQYFEVTCELIGELIAEFKGIQTGSRVLADGKLEGSSTGSGNLMGKEAMEMDTAVLTPMPNGALMIEGNGMIMTAEGETVMVKTGGIGWLAGKGLKSSGRGASYFMTSSPKLAGLNKTVGVWERESDEKGDFTIKVWAWI